MLRNLTVCLSFLLISFTFWGCATVSGSGDQFYDVNVQSLSAVSATSFDFNYVILPADPSLSVNDLQFVIFADELERLIVQKGARRLPADQKDVADVAILLGYGISGPQQEISTVSRPQFGTAGYQVMSGGYLAPTYGYTGYADETVITSVHQRMITLEAVDAKTLKDGINRKQLWKMTITSTGTTDNLSKVFPYMLTAGGNCLGGTTQGTKTFKIWDQNWDAAVLEACLPIPGDPPTLAPKTIIGGTINLSAP